MSIIKTIKDLLAESLYDNRKLIVGLYIAFIAVFIAAWMLSSGPVGDAVENMQVLTADNSTDSSSYGPVELFVHNGIGGIETYFESVLFAVPSLVMLFYTALSLGVFGQLFSALSVNGGLEYIIYLIPHGIFEITGTVIQAAAGILLFVFIVRFIRAWLSKETDGASEAFEKTKKVLIQSLVLIAFATVLMAIAAPIEAYFSVPFAEFVVGLL